jgi:hypothetical protein
MEIKEIDRTMTHDKEWKLLRKADNRWRIITLDCLSGVEKEIEEKINNIFRKVNLNDYKNDWNICKKYMAEKLKSGDYKIVEYIEPSKSFTDMTLPV